jgi:protein transport protein SEC20
MAAELQKSQFAHDTLKESTAALAQLGETYSTLDTLLSSSKNLLGTLLRSQKSDTWYLETAFYILAATVAWLVFRRILYGPLYYPVYWLFWFLSIPLNMFIKGWLGIFAALDLTGGQSVESGVTSVASSMPTVSHRTAGRLSAPSGARTPPGVNVGGGGKGAPMHSQGPPAGQEGSVTEQVGRIIDESKEQEAGKEEEEGMPENETAEEPKNPKKRMWEEDKEAAKEEQRKKDEL